VAYVGGLEVAEVEEGGVVHGGRGPSRGVLFIGIKYAVRLCNTRLR